MPSPLGKIAYALAPSAVSTPKGITWGGIAVFVVGALVFLSAFSQYRVTIGGLYVHAYLIPLAPLLGFVLITRLGGFPLVSLGLFILSIALYIFATLAGPGYLEEDLKVFGAAASMITPALLIRSEKDFRLGVIGLIGAIVGLSIIGLQSTVKQFVGVNPLDIGDENAFSLYTLPPLLLAGFVALDRSAAKWLRILMIPAMLIVVVAMFSNANRSGWLGILLIAAMLLATGLRKNWRAAAFAVLMAGLGFVVVMKFSDLELVQFRYAETFSDRSRDFIRTQLFVGCLQVGISNPVLGVSPQLVSVEVPRRIGMNGRSDAHNVFGGLFAGTGLLPCCIYGWFAWTLFRKPRSGQANSLNPAIPTDPTVITPHQLLRMMMVLWAVRGSFSEAILFSPGFCMGMGLVIGLCITTGTWQQQKRRGALVAPRHVALRPA